MTARLRNALMRLGEPELQQYVGKEVVRYMSLLNQPISAGALADVLIERLGGEIISPRHSQLRDQLIMAMGKSDAIGLEELICGAASDTPWANILGQDLGDTSPKQMLVRRFFGLSEPVPVPEPIQIAARQRLTAGYSLYEYQMKVVSSAIRKINTGDKRALIHMPTGAGKTRAAMALIGRLLSENVGPRVIVWLAHSEELCEQAAEEFTKCWSMIGDREVELGRFFGPREFDLSDFKDGIIVAGLAKLYSRSLSQQSAFLSLKNRLRLVVMDEAHQALAPTYQHLMEMLAPEAGAVSLLGLSATPGRSWLNKGEDQKLAKFFSGQKVTLEVPGNGDPIKFLQEEGYLAVPDYRPVPYTPTVGLSAQDRKAIAQGLDISVETLQKLGDDEQRNLIILQEILAQVEKGARMIVFACSVQHANMLADLLVAKGVKAAAVSASTSTERRHEILSSFKDAGPDAPQVVVNFAILTAGFDAPKTNTVVVARPTQSVVLYSQMIGRAMRGTRSGGNDRCTVITVQDNLPGFRNVYEGFFHWEDVW